jgi:phage terminase large subunit-like protein
MASQLAALPEKQRKKILAALSVQERARLDYAWPFWARPNQLAPPGDWRVWLVCAGRRYGKTRLGGRMGPRTD